MTRYRITSDECGDLGIEIKECFLAPWVDAMELRAPMEGMSPVLLPVRRKALEEIERWIEEEKRFRAEKKARVQAYKRHVLWEIGE